MKRYNNYHRHDHISNIFTPDTNAHFIDYVNRALELGETNVWTTNHGSGGDIFEAKQIADANGLNVKFGIEGYIVPNPLKKDARNYHIILIPKTNVARKKINLASSHANIEGYYYKPRLFLDDLLKINKDEIYITTACCFLKNNKVLTINGYKNIQEITSNDLVKNIYGEWEKVNYPTKINYNGIGYIIKTNNYLDNITCTADHKFLATTLNDIHTNKQPKWIEAQEIYNYTSYNTKPILLYPLNNNIYTNKNIIYKKEFDGIYKTKKHHTTKQNLPDKIIITPQFMRMIGLFIGDGHITLKKLPRIGFTFNIKEYDYFNEDVFKPIEKQLGITFNRYFRPNNHRVDISTTSIDVINLFYYLFGVCKADTKYIPNKLLHISKEYDSELLLGMLLSDGCFRNNYSGDKKYPSGECIYCSISKQLILQFQNLCNSLGIKNNFRISNEYIDKNNIHHKRSYQIIICSKKFINFTKHTNITTQQWTEIINNLYDNCNQTPVITYNNQKYLKVRIKDIQKININEEVYCLNNNSHSFVLNGCIVHNCAGLLKDNDSYNEIFLPLVEHFGKNVFLEVQNHNFDIQKEINEKALWCQEQYGLELIAANDSHYIYPEQSKERLELLKGKGITYDDEDSFVLDYPDYDTVVERFIAQGILTEEQVIKAINNTLIFDEVENIDINTDIKMPTIYPNKTDEEKYQILVDYLNDNFEKVMDRDNVPLDKRDEYIEECKKELQVIYDTKDEIHTPDYFLLNVNVIDKAVNEYGGVLTRTGRGSCGSFLINKILGITQIDRLTVDLPMYSDRFMSTARLLENKAMPDIDMNISAQEPFVKATRDLLGEYGCYPMVAYGTMKISEAFRNICRSHNLPYDSYNEVAKSVESYENNLEWKDLITEAKKYVGTIVSASVHPCAHLLLNGDIREELGVVRIGENICTMITSNEADIWKYLKNDYLIVTVWDIIDKVFKMINRPIMTIKEVLNNIDENVWKLFDDGLTCTLNQVDGSWATELLTKFKPRTLEELTMFVASIRPSFESLRDDFIDRKPYSTGSKYLDELFKNTYNRCVFQENIMKYFEWLGVTPAESIGLIKKISKKKIHKEDFDKLEERLKEHWKENTGSYDGFDESWADMQSNMSYSFNSPHGLATALDCLYCAYLKANYPVEYYTVVFNLYSNDGVKSERLTNECKYFNIKIEPPMFRHSTSEYSCDTDNKIIYKGIGSIKNIGDACGNNLYTLKDKIYSNFIELLYDIFINKLAQKNEIDKLIKINFFREFGDINQLLVYHSIFLSLYKRKTLKSSELDVFGITLEDIKPYIEKATEKTISGINMPKVIEVICSNQNYEPITNIERISYDMGILNHTDIIDDTIPNNIFVVGNIETNKYGTKFITVYHPQTGEYYQNKVKRSAYDYTPCDSGDIIKAVFNTQYKRKKNENDEWVQSEEQEKILKNYTIIKKFE